MRYMTHHDQYARSFTAALWLWYGRESNRLNRAGFKEWNK